MRHRGPRPWRPVWMLALLAVVAATGVAPAARGTITLVSSGSRAYAGNGPSFGASVSTSGRFVAFTSAASDLVDENNDGIAQDDLNGKTDVLVRDLLLGVTARISRASPSQGNPLGAEADADSHSPAISGDGRYVAFVSRATNLTGNPDTEGFADIYVRDRDRDGDLHYDEPGTGQTVTYRISISGDGLQGNGDSWEPAISRDGRTIAFTSLATNLVAPSNKPGIADVYVRSLFPERTLRITVSSTGKLANAESGEPSVSADGRFIAFTSAASNLLDAPSPVLGEPADRNRVRDVFVHDRDSDGNGVYDEVGGIRASRISVGGDPSSSQQFEGRFPSYDPAIVANPLGVGDRRQYQLFVAFTSESDLTSRGDGPFDSLSQDRNGVADVYLRDATRATTTLVSVHPEGDAAAATSGFAALTDDGSVVAFWSEAADHLGYTADGTPVDQNESADVFVRDVLGGFTEAASMNDLGDLGDAGSLAPSMSADGTLVAFESLATNFDPLDSDPLIRFVDVYVRHRFACPSYPEDRAVSGTIHDAVEPNAGPARRALHDTNCDHVARNGL